MVTIEVIFLMRNVVKFIMKIRILKYSSCGSIYQTSHFIFFQLGANRGSSSSAAKWRANDFQSASPPGNGVALIVEFRSLWSLNGGSSLWGVSDAAHILRSLLILPTDTWSQLKKRSAASNCTWFSYGHQLPCSGRGFEGGGLVLGGIVVPYSLQGTAKKIINCKIGCKQRQLNHLMWCQCLMPHHSSP